MMKLLLKITFAVVMLMMLFYSGCELITKPPEKPRVRPAGSDLVINEVFTLSPDKYYAYSWIELFNPTSKYISWFVNSFPATMYAVGTNGALIETADDGIGGWKSFTDKSGTPPATFYAIDFPLVDTAFAVGDNGLIRKLVRDTSGSVTASDLISGTTRNLYTVISNGGISYVGGQAGTILRTINFGAAWTVQTSNTTNALRAGVFHDFSRIFMVGDSGTIVKKAGVPWVKQNVPLSFQSTNFTSIAMATDTGFVVGENGKILFTKNSGVLWKPETCFVAPKVPLTTTLRAVFTSDSVFGNNQLGRAWAAGDGGTIIRTDDYGQHWRILNSGTSTKINALNFTDSLKGWAFGDNGLVLATTDGGDNWKIQASATTENLLAVHQLPLSILTSRRYVIQMLAKRKAFFRDPFNPQNINFDFYTKIDTGLLLFDPLIISAQSGADLPKPVRPDGFVVVNSDSNKFKDHTKLGPGTTTILNVSIGYYLDPTSSLGATAVKWDLLSAGEIRLIKINQRRSLGPQGKDLGSDTTDIEVIRYGNYVPTTAVFSPGRLFLNNHPVGFIPEGYSLARYADDGGGLPPEQQDTRNSFFFAKNPIPGWFSQESHP